MQLQEFRETVLEVYTFLYTRILDKGVRKINLAQHGQGTTLDKFCARVLERYGEAAGTDWIVDYLVYQVHYWHDKDTRYKVTLGWVLGEKALERFLRRPPGKTWYEDRMLQEKLGMSREELKKRWRLTTGEHPLQAYRNPVHEERIKAQYLNTEFGFFQCQTLTTLYTDCETCRKCLSQGKCKDLLKKIFPELARIRGIH